MQDTCAYCGQPLRLIAGFCAACHAPTMVAARARLVAGARQRSDLPSGMPRSHVGTQSAVFTPASPRGSRLLLVASVLCLAVASVCIYVNVNHRTIAALMLAPRSALQASATAGGVATTTFTVGQTIFLRYGVNVDQMGADITLTVAPPGAPAHLLTERWPQGATERTQNLVALIPGTWSITLQVNGQIIRAATIMIVATRADSIIMTKCS